MLSALLLSLLLLLGVRATHLRRKCCLLLWGHTSQSGAEGLLLLRGELRPATVVAWLLAWCTRTSNIIAGSGGGAIHRRHRGSTGIHWHATLLLSVRLALLPGPLLLI